MPCFRGVLHLVARRPPSAEGGRGCGASVTRRGCVVVPRGSSHRASVKSTHGGAPAIAHAAGGGPPRSRETRSQRGLRRRELQLGKKGAPPLDLLDVVRAAKSWRSATAMVFLSPFTWPALRHMKPASLTPPSRRDSSTRSRPV